MRGQGGRGGLQGRQRRERAGQVSFECSNASDGHTGHSCRRSLRISTVPCRSWPRDTFARTVHSGAPSRWARAVIPLEATLRRWYRRRMAKIRRQRFWRRTGLLLLLLAVEVMVASTARPRLLYSTSTSTRSTTASPRSFIPSTGGLEPSTSNKRVWVGRHPRC